jgi:hypothetical protein
VGCGGAEFASSLQAVDYRSRLAFDSQQDVAVLVRHGVWHWNTALCQVFHQVQIKRQLRVCEALKQREHVLAFAAGEEVVGVLNAALDAFEFDQLAQLELGQQFLRGGL